MSSSPKKREVRFNSTGWLLGFLGAMSKYFGWGYFEVGDQKLKLGLKLAANKLHSSDRANKKHSRNP